MVALRARAGPVASTVLHQHVVASLFACLCHACRPGLADAGWDPAEPFGCCSERPRRAVTAWVTEPPVPHPQGRGGEGRVSARPPRGRAGRGSPRLRAPAGARVPSAGPRRRRAAAPAAAGLPGCGSWHPPGFARWKKSEVAAKQRPWWGCEGERSAKRGKAGGKEPSGFAEGQNEFAAGRDGRLRGEYSKGWFGAC